MPGTITYNDFSAGWCPSDNDFHGRKNALLAMDNVELDQNGALTQIRGEQLVRSGLPGNAHTLYSRIMGGARHDYAALGGGQVYRDSTSIVTGGDTSRAAFGTAFNFTLIASGTQRKKDTGAGVPVNLGLITPAPAPDLSPVVATAQIQVSTTLFILNDPFLKAPKGTYLIDGDGILRLKANADGIVILESWGLTTTPYDWSVFSDGGIETNDDEASLYIGSFVPANDTLQIDFILEPLNAAGAYSDYYSFEVGIEDLQSFYPESPNFGAYFIQMKRGDFTRVGSSSAGWDTVYGFRIVYTTAKDIGLALGLDPQATLGMIGGSHAQNGLYEYAQINVNNTGLYLAKSELGPASVPIRSHLAKNWIIPSVPSEPQVNEVWLFRRSINGEGTLDQWYRVAQVVNSGGGWAFPVRDSMGDEEALTLDITVNLNLLSLISSRLTDKILDIVGPIEGRWLYFTTNTMYPSDINDPDLVDASLGVKTTSSVNETFLWARAVSDSTILVATSLDIYLLSGTFSTLPDNSVDLYYRPLHCQFPPITADVAIHNSTAYYLANDGWRAFSLGGGNPSLVAPNTDQLYRNIPCYGYTGVDTKFLAGTKRFPVCIVSNKLWCFVTGTGRCEVYDFVRQYWRVIINGHGDATACFATQDGYVLVGYPAALFYHLDAITTTQQSIRILTNMNDGGLHKQRKDSYTLTVRAQTGLRPTLKGYLAAKIRRDDGITIDLTTTPFRMTETDYPADMSLDISSAVGPTKSYQVELTGLVYDLILTDIIIDFEPRPPQLTSYKRFNTNFGNANKKRLRVWPLVIDTLGLGVRFKLFADNVDVTAAAVSNPLILTGEKTTYRVYIISDLFAVDYGYELTGPQTAFLADEGIPPFNANRPLFEFWEDLPPDIVQVLPIARRFDQVGPQELFKYGKIKQLELRVLPFGPGATTSLPFRILFNDNTKQTGSLTVTNNIEQSYYFGAFKGVSGQIVRIELGPTTYDFHRYYVRAAVAIGGKYTELNWVTLG